MMKITIEECFMLQKMLQRKVKTILGETLKVIKSVESNEIRGVDWKLLDYRII